MRPRGWHCRCGKSANKPFYDNTHGKDATPYEHLPFFYSDLFDLGYEAVGELDSRLKTVSDWREPPGSTNWKKIAGLETREVVV